MSRVCVSVNDLQDPVSVMGRIICVVPLGEIVVMWASKL